MELHQHSPGRGMEGGESGSSRGVGGEAGILHGMRDGIPTFPAELGLWVSLGSQGRALLVPNII